MISESRRQTSAAYSGCALMPVPIAVAPRLHDCVCREFLAERHRHRVLQLGASHFQHVAKFLGFRLECAAQNRHRIDQLENAEVSRDLQRRRVDVVGALAHVDVLVRMQVLVFAAVVPEMLEREVRNHLVGIHVRRRAGAALDHVDDELVVQLAVAYLAACLHDRVRALLVEQSDFVVRARRCFLDARERAEQVRIDGDRVAGDRKVLDGAQRVDTEVRGGRHGAISEQIVLDTNFVRLHAITPSVGPSIRRWKRVAGSLQSRASGRKGASAGTIARRGARAHAIRRASRTCA